MRATPHAFVLIIGLTLLAPAIQADVTPIEFTRRQLVGSVGYSLVVGELDGSPLPELVGASGADILVLRNEGGRNFSSPQSISMEGGVLGDPHLADLDGDGRLDILAIQATPAALVVRRNLGGFTFAPVESYPVPHQPLALATGDLNGDGRADAVVVCADSLASFLALAGGVLAGHGLEAQPLRAACAAFIADLDADTVPDLLTSEMAGSYLSWTIQWRRGLGDAAFEDTMPIDNGPFDFPTILAADLDSDGDLDVIHLLDGGLFWLANDGHGAFEARTPLHSGGGRSLDIGDVDGDGKVDVVVSAGSTWNGKNVARVIYSALDDSAPRIAQWHIPMDPGAIALSDLDGDGRLDVATSCQSGADNPQSRDPNDAFGASTALLWSEASGLMLGRLMIPLDGDHPTSHTPWSLVSLRTSPGVVPDLVVTSHERTWLLRNTGNGMFHAPLWVGVDPARAAVDFDRDGCDELVVTRNDTTLVLPRLASGEGFGPPIVTLTGLNYVGTGDFNGDGSPDIALEDASAHLWMRPGDGSGSFGPVVDLLGSLPDPHGVVHIADFNADGRADVVSEELYAVYVSSIIRHAVLHTLINNGYGALLAESTDSLSIESLGLVGGDLTSGDIDGDGDRDLVMEVGTWMSGSPAWFGSFLNDGSGDLHASGPVRFAGNPAGPIGCADLNADGLSDLLLHESDGFDWDFHAYEAIGGGAFAPLSYLNGVESALDLAIDDFDGDGRPDVALLSWHDYVTIMRNATPFGPTPALVSLSSARVIGQCVELEWSAPGEGVFRAEIERSTGSADWQRIADMNSNGTGHVRFTDSDVEPGTRYGYRLRYRDGPLERLTSETWVEVPSLALALRAPQPSPVQGAVAFGLTLPTAGEARLEVLDISGRRVRGQRLIALAAGEHRIALEGGPLPPGLYFARLAFGAQRAATRFIVVR